jgi:hypothetical protein
LFYYLLQLCQDIYRVRERGELDLEQDLFLKLTFIFDSPPILIKWTQPREEDEGKEGNAQPTVAQCSLMEPEMVTDQNNLSESQ